MKSPVHAGLVDALRMIQRNSGTMATAITDESWGDVVRVAEWIKTYAETIKRNAERIQGK